MHTYTNIWMHFVWSTHKRKRIISDDLKEKLISHYKEYGNNNNIDVDTVNGDLDHLHLLIRLRPTQSASEVANRLKGESSNWINKNNYIKGKFAWQSGYGVFSVSESQLGIVRLYIHNQQKHHLKKCYQEELAEILTVKLV